MNFISMKKDPCWGPHAEKWNMIFLWNIPNYMMILINKRHVIRYKFKESYGFLNRKIKKTFIFAAECRFFHFFTIPDFLSVIPFNIFLFLFCTLYIILDIIQKSYLFLIFGFSIYKHKPNDLITEKWIFWRNDISNIDSSGHLDKKVHIVRN